jgi:O-antigen/teichoic acid export membrane protein
MTRGALRANVAWMLAGNLVFAASQYGVLAAVAKLGTPTLVGWFQLSFAVTAPIVALTNSNLRAVQATDTHHEVAFADYAGQRALAIVASLLITAAAMIVGGYVEAGWVLFWVASSKGVESASDVLYGMLQQRERHDRMAIAMITRGVLSVVAVAAVLYATGSLATAVAAMFLVRVVTLVGLEGPMSAAVVGGWSALVPRFDRALLWKVTRTALPLGAVGMLFSLTHNVPRYALEWSFDAHTLGIYAACAWLVQAGQTVVSALGQAVLPRMAAHYRHGRRASFLKVAGALWGAGAALGIAGVVGASLVGETALRILYTDEYAPHVDVLVAVAAAGALTYLTWLGQGITNAMRRFDAQVPLALTVVAVTAGVCVWVVPTWGAIGAAIGWGAGQVVYLAWSVALVIGGLRRMPSPP